MTGCSAAVPVGRADVHAMLAKPAEPGGDRSVRRGEHAAFTRGEELARVKGEGGERGPGADRAAPVRGSGGAGGVLDHGDLARIAQRADRIQVSGRSRLVDQDDGAGRGRSGAAPRSPG